MPDGVKEIFFFDRHYDRGIEFYKSHFHPQPEDKLIMEISTTAFDQKDAPVRVREMFGHEVKLLCPLRNPVVRSYSLYLHYLRYGIVKGSLREACFQNPQIIESSKYSKHLQRWFSYFGQDNVHLVFQEDLEENQNTYIRNVCEALDIPFIAPTAKMAERYNVTTYSGSSSIAGMAQQGADWLRKHRLYFVINLAKKAGLKRLIFGRENPDAEKTSIPGEDKLWLEEQLGEEREKLESLIGKIPQWQ